MADVVLGSGTTRLRFATDRSRPDAPADVLVVSVEGPGLTASLDVHPHVVEGFLDLVDFVEGLERDFRGWPGERVYELLESDLRLAATHLGARIWIDVVLWRFWAPEPWRCEAVVALEPGEELRRAAVDLGELLRPR